MSSLNPKIRFIIFLVTTLIIFGGFGWYNYGIYSAIGTAKKTIKNLDSELKTQDQVRNSILEAQKQRKNKIEDLGRNVFFTMREYELTAVTMKELAKKYDIDVLSLNLQSNEIDGNIDLYDNDVIFLTVGLIGDLRNPEILVGKDTFSTDKNKKSQNIKTIFEEGIRSLIDDYLKLND